MTITAKHLAGLGLLWALSLLIGLSPFLQTMVLAWRDDQFTYILLILPLSVALIFLEWHSLRTKLVFNVRAGSIILVTALLIVCSSLLWAGSWSADMRLSIAMFALVLSWCGLFVFCMGLQASREVLFPLFFLFGLVPLPQPALGWVVALLQQGSTAAAHALFAICGVPVTQDGVTLTIPGLTLQVAQECSSIRSSSMLLVTTMVLAELLLRSPWRKLLVIVVAIPLSVAKNGLRVFSIAMLGTRVDREFITGAFHHQGGILFFAIALIVIFVLLWILRMGDDPSPKSTPRPVRTATAVD
jgi:exosortase